MPPYFCTEIKEIALFNPKTGEKLFDLTPPLEIQGIETEPINFNLPLKNKFSMSVELNGDSYYKLRKIFIANNKAKHRYKQIQKSKKIFKRMK